MITHLLFDLDDTLYPADNGVWHAISGRISAFMRSELGMGPDEVRAARQRYARSFGTSLAGLMADHGVDPDEYLEFVHDIRLHDLVQPDPALREVLAGLPQDKSVFTNASRSHAFRVLKVLQVDDLFNRVISIETLDLVNKPELAAYTRALRALGEPDPSRCLFADDRERNLIPAGRLGMTTVLVNPGGRSAEGVDHSIGSIHELSRAVPSLLTEEADHGVA